MISTVAWPMPRVKLGKESTGLQVRYSHFRPVIGGENFRLTVRIPAVTVPPLRAEASREAGKPAVFGQPAFFFWTASIPRFASDFDRNHRGSTAGISLIPNGIVPSESVGGRLDLTGRRSATIQELRSANRIASDSMFGEGNRSGLTSPGEPGRREKRLEQLPCCSQPAGDV